MIRLQLRFSVWLRLSLALMLASLINVQGFAQSRFDAMVAADGSGACVEVQSAIDSIPAGRRQRFVIEVKPGVYREKITLKAGGPPVSLIGEDAAKTVLTFNNNANLLDAAGNKLGTFASASVNILANDFTAQNITFENSAGPVGQALAISISGDRAVFERCRFLGWQDTILAKSGRQYFKDCYIAGHVDFIFGAATAFFDHCELHCLQGGAITAASTPMEQRFGFVFSHCKITAAPGKWKTILGRPWRPYAAVVFLNTEMPEQIAPKGWGNWKDPAREKTARYAEYGNSGPGANPEARVKWAKKLTAAEAANYTPEVVLAGTDGWNPKKGP
jgi:pectinesterase